MLNIKFDVKAYNRYKENMSLLLANEKLNNLLNANGIYNLPNININTDNQEILAAQQCRNSPYFLGKLPSNVQDCQNVCFTKDVDLLHVESGQEVFIDDVNLSEGYWCLTRSIPNCNLNISYLTAGVNGFACVTKYPKLVNGTGTIVACNNENIYDPNNILWDYLTNTPFNPLTTQLNNEDELLPSGTFRFSCKYNGRDSMGNKYKESPVNRFQPIIDYCISDIYRSAYESVGIEFDTNLTKYQCNCGNYNDTRVKNKNPGDITTICTSCFNEYNENDHTYKYGHNCYTINSPFTDMFKYPPCQKSKFLIPGSFCENTSLDFKQTVASRNIEFDTPMTDTTFGLHPLADKFIGHPLITSEYAV